MKLWKKLVLFIITIISIILACSRYYIVKNNFLHSIENTSKQNTNQHILEKYMLENYIVKNIEDGEELTYEKIIEYVKSLNNYIEDDSKYVAVYTEQYEQIYSSIMGIENVDVKAILNPETETYCLKEIAGKHYMLFSSHWLINDKIIYIINAYNVNSIYEEKNRELRDILFTDIIILLISIIVIAVFSIFITRPIDSLNKISKKIAFGKFNERANIKSKDEIGELANSFNKMAEQIENKINELNMQVKQKNDFINGFTHELKTPMTSIVGYADLLRLKKCDEETSRKAIQYIYSETKRLESLSFKLMKLMSLSEEKIELVDFEVKTFMQKISKAESNILINNKLVLDIENATIKGDKELLEVVMRNLIENASKAEPKDKKILIKGEKVKNNKYRISVIDKGKGIPKEHLNRVTEDFYMVDKARASKNGGSGIGLSLVKKILIFHNSNIVIESKENIGTTAYFELEEAKND